MNWKQIQRTYPNQWLLVDVHSATSEAGKRVLSDMDVMQSFGDVLEAMGVYKTLHHETPERELYVLHSSLETPEVEERRWVGVRGVS